MSDLHDSGLNGFTSAYTPSQNGKIERRNRTLIETARTLLNEAKLNDGILVTAANYLLNLWPQKIENPNRTYVVEIV